MSVLHALWLPILLSAAIVFVVSSIIHMVLPWHKGDYRKLPAEDQVLDVLNAAQTSPGDYMLPYMGAAERSSPEFKAKFARGPVVIATIRPGGFAMGKSLALWFLYAAAISYFAAYIAAHSLPPGAVINGHPKHIRAIFVSAFLGYAAALWPSWIWFGKSFVATLKSNIDGLIYAALTAYTFHLVWPK